MAESWVSPIEALLAQVNQRPERVAVASSDGEITYRELEARSNAVAVALSDGGLRRGDRVGLRLDRSTNLIVHIVAAWKIGLCYVPLDPAYPSQRTEQILDLARPRAIVDDDSMHLTQIGGHEDPSETGYLIFTSGSTGTPKGVPVTDAMVGALLAVALPQFDFEPDDRWALMHSYNFDFSVWEIWGALTTGASLHVPSQATLRSPVATMDFLRDSAVTVLNQVPSVFTQLALTLEDEETNLPQVRHVILGGEDVRRANLAAWRATGSSAVLTNMYGITEVTVHATCRRLDDIDDSLLRSSIGMPLPGFEHRVVDSNLDNVRRGDVGELLLAGPQVAAGYFRNQSQTREQMIDLDGRSWYRTGDLVAEIDGELLYVGRSDGQVQLRGYRIETGEVEQVIARSGLARQQAVCVVERPTGLQLIAIIVVGDGSLVADQIHAYLRSELPAYMVPSRIVEVDSLPVTPSGKLDTRALLSAGETL